MDKLTWRLSAALATFGLLGSAAAQDVTRAPLTAAPSSASAANPVRASTLKQAPKLRVVRAPRYARPVKQRVQPLVSESQSPQRKVGTLKAR